MNILERWFIQRIIQREVRQGYDHPQRITEMYRMIRKASEREFYEDNSVTLKHFLTERFNYSFEEKT